MHIDSYSFSLDFSDFKRKGEARPLDSVQVSIEQAPVCRSILVTGISENTTHDTIQLCFENRKKNCGGPVEKVYFTPGSGRAVVVFKDPKGVQSISIVAIKYLSFRN